MAKIFPISDLRRRTAEVIGAVQAGSGVVYITQYGRPSVVLVDYEYYETLMSQLEDLSDMVSLQVAADEPARPYGEFLTEMGLSQQDAAPDDQHRGVKQG